MSRPLLTSPHLTHFGCLHHRFIILYQNAHSLLSRPRRWDAIRDCICLVATMRTTCLASEAGRCVELQTVRSIHVGNSPCERLHHASCMCVCDWRFRNNSARHFASSSFHKLETCALTRAHMPFVSHKTSMLEHTDSETGCWMLSPFTKVRRPQNGNSVAIFRTASPTSNLEVVFSHFKEVQHKLHSYLT